ncbi:MAG: molecular chaperone HtpG [Clostridiales bacterium]|nr:molecular chaperone HtpG [Clostridiales bacterium]
MSVQQHHKKGSISIDAQNIMPVIKRWLYSDKDIFIRELVSNGADAITKLKMLGLGQEDDLRITVTVDKKAGELRFEDNGIGMTANEVEKYINQVAFSSAEDFLKTYTGEDQSGIIGHFGLGFYSAFMAAGRVVIDTLSHQEGAEPVRWVSEDGIAFEMDRGTRETRGTVITLHIMDEEKEFLDGWRVREVLEKYCGFMAVPIYLVDLEALEREAEAAEKRRAEKAEKAAEKAKESADGETTSAEVSDDAEEEEDTEEPAPAEPKPINDTHPLWLKNPRDCTDEEYKETYRKVFRTFEDPLFWIHLNVDYPFNLKGILYFPHIRRDFAGQEGEIKLFNRQVFVADNIKEVIPEFLMVLKGVIDCPDLPLNVSRSFLQNDGYVKRISNHIAKKVADRLNGLHNTERKTYEGYWDDIHPFIKYGCLQDRKFYDAVKDSLLLKTTADEYLTFDEYKARNEGKAEKKIYYASEPNRQAASVALYTAQGIDVAVMDTLIDMNFMSFIEYSGMEVQFVRVDSDVTGLTEDSDEGAQLDQAHLEKLFRDALDNQELAVKLEALSDRELPAMLTEDEQMRRFKEMSVIYGRDFSMPDKYTLVLNRLSPVVQALAGMEEGEDTQLMCRQVYDLARLSSRPLEAGDLKAFISRSNKVLAMMAEKADKA